MESTTTPYRNRSHASPAETSLTAKGRPAIARDANPLMPEFYGSILEPLGEVEACLVEQLQNQDASVGELLSHGTQLGGKRMRPAMLLLSAMATGHRSRDHVILATVIEMVHTATLVHDDVLDHAQTRRHVPTVNAKWDNHTSILLGDYLFAQSFYLAATLSDTQACRWVGEAAREVCEGELRQVLSRGLVGLSEHDYLEIIRGKTAALCRVACSLGASHAGASDDLVDALGRYGDAVGIAFQIADDYLDLWGDEEAIGKTLGTDLEQGKVTLPLIRMLATANPLQREEIIAVIQGSPQQRFTRLRHMLQQSDAQTYTLAVAQAYRTEAIDALERLPPSDAKRALVAIANFAIERKF